MKIINGKMELSNITLKGVKKMKKLIMIVMALAMAALFLPCAEAGDTANLGLQVSFSLPSPIKMWTEPEGPFIVEEGKRLQFKVLAEDGQYGSQITIECNNPPEGARFEDGLFNWTPVNGQGQDDPYKVVFSATSSEGAKATLGVSITVNKAKPVISIELVDANGNPVSTWSLVGVKLGEKVDNKANLRVNLLMPGILKPMHNIRNAGNVAVTVDIGYGGYIMPSKPGLSLYPIIRPGLEQGKDTFITGLGRVDNHTVLPPNKRLKAGSVKPEQMIPLWLTYGAPTEVSKYIKSHSTSYSLRAYGSIDPRE